MHTPLSSPAMGYEERFDSGGCGGGYGGVIFGLMVGKMLCVMVVKVVLSYFLGFDGGSGVLLSWIDSEIVVEM